MNEVLLKIKIAKEIVVISLLLAALVSSCDSRRTARELIQDVAALRMVVEEVEPEKGEEEKEESAWEFAY